MEGREVKRKRLISGRRGFSLLELLAVMSIMAMLTTLAVVSYFGSIRGMTRRSAVKQLANTLILARQRACMEGARVSVMIYNEVTGYKKNDAGDYTSEPVVAPSYVVCKEIGRISFISGVNLVDEYASLDSTFTVGNPGGSTLVSTRLYNLTQGKWSNVYTTVKEHKRKVFSAYDPDAEYEIKAYAFVENSSVSNPNKASWDVGDAYGVEVAPVNALPNGFEFSELGDSLSQVVSVTFQPDGTANNETLRITELRPPQKRIEMKIAQDGSITYTDKWN